MEEKRNVIPIAAFYQWECIIISQVANLFGHSFCLDVTSCASVCLYRRLNHLTSYGFWQYASIWWQCKQSKPPECWRWTSQRCWPSFALILRSTSERLTENAAMTRISAACLPVYTVGRSVAVYCDWWTDHDAGVQTRHPPAAPPATKPHTTYSPRDLLHAVFSFCRYGGFVSRMVFVVGGFYGRRDLLHGFLLWGGLSGTRRCHSHYQPNFHRA